MRRRIIAACGSAGTTARQEKHKTASVTSELHFLTGLWAGWQQGERMYFCKDKAPLLQYYTKFLLLPFPSGNSRRGGASAEKTMKTFCSPGSKPRTGFRGARKCRCKSLGRPRWLGFYLRCCFLAHPALLPARGRGSLAFCYNA